MTAEVAIANSGAVALAADSAVTIGGQKIYNSALKLFALSKTEPIGVMVYGNSALLHVPWETLIKSYREVARDQKFSTASEYTDDLIAYLETNPGLFSEESQNEWIKANVRGYYELLRDELFEAIHPILKEHGEVESDTVKGLFSDIVKRHHSNLSDREYSERFDKEFEKQLRSDHKETFRGAREAIFENLSVSSAVAAKLYDIAAMLQTREIFSTGTSGIVIAGYGSDDIFPTINTVEIEGFTSGRLKYSRRKDKSHVLAGGNECTIFAFAQEDMVASFMNGINPSISGLLGGYLRQVFERIPELLEGCSMTERERKHFRENANRILTEFFDQLNSHIRNDHVDPVLKMVMALPKDELAEMAETLVNLTAFKRRMTESMETVGGPVDVAVISKGDGLVWVKRKHYFPAELNQHFFRNYFRGIDND